MRLIDADLFMQRIESYNTLDEKDKALYNFALHEIVCMPTVDVLEQITDEIRQIVDEETKYDEKWARGLHYSLCIIDKYKEQTE